MARVRIGSDEWELRVGGVPPGKDWLDLMDAHPSIESELRRLKQDSRAMGELRSLCGEMSVAAQSLSEDELVQRVGASLRNRRVRGYRKKKAKDKAKDKTKADGKSQPAGAVEQKKQDPRVIRIRVGSEEWEIRAGGPKPDKDDIDLMKVHPWIEPFLAQCRLNLRSMQDFRRLNQYLSIPDSSQTGNPVYLPQPAAAPRSVMLPTQLGDDELLTRIATGLRLRQLWGIRIQKDEQAGGSAASSAPAPATPGKSEAEQPEPDPNTFDPNHDGAAQAATLQQAAQLGVPFCEECAKRAAQQAA